MTMIDDIRGVAFPFRIDPTTGGVAMAKGGEKIRQNVRLILGVRLGERPMLRDFGTRLSSLVHEPNDDVMADLIQNQTHQALLQWEPRILITGMQVEQQDGEAVLRLNYMHTDEPVSNQTLLPLF
jgi:phage baseplate assembly protein W